MDLKSFHLDFSGVVVVDVEVVGEEEEEGDIQTGIMEGTRKAATASTSVSTRAKTEGTMLKTRKRNE
jgi:hypothetical protein